MRLIDADDLKTAFPVCDNSKSVLIASVRATINHMPTIEPQRKKGKWIDRGWSGDGRGNSWHEWECSECKHITKGAKWDFCPNCGADMREDGEEPKKCDTCKHVKSQWFNRCADCSDYELWEGKEEPYKEDR